MTGNLCLDVAHIGLTTLYMFLSCNVFNICILFNYLTVISPRSYFYNNWYQIQKVYLVGKLIGKRGSWFQWEQWKKKEILGSIISTTKTTIYGRCKWRTIYTKRIIPIVGWKNKTMKNGRFLTERHQEQYSCAWISWWLSIYKNKRQLRVWWVHWLRSMKNPWLPTR